MGKLSQYARNRVISLRMANNSIVNIVRILQEEDGIKTSRTSVSSFIARYQRTGSIDDAQRSGRKSILSEEDVSFIDEKMKANDELTSGEIQKLLRDERGVTISTSTIRNVRRKKLGWKHEKARYCQLIREKNKVKRLVFCLKAMKEKDSFENAIFSDETTVEIQQYTRYCFRKNGSLPKRKGRPKHPLKVHVWAGISYRGATKVCIFTGIMESIGYQTILERNLLPFIASEYPDGHRFWQDNDPKHTSNSTKEWMKANGINHWPTPPESPDLNPIENFWANLKHHLRKFTKPTNKEELVQGIQEYWKTVTPAMCQRYVNHVRKVVPAVIACGGGPTGY
ncbi:Transposable element Tcb2 transposase [Paramuricea clavata]|uniref:Transposable element Tcb2 transposase n=1 Tax=Paramuricea clavata TaxID=317549 RepID=A0A6S7HT22_PARCT|nr:Transposable element Tcb2 transposase [Paramuricea clavata]